MIPRVVFDCMIFLQAAARPDGPAAACLERVNSGRAELIISADVVAELRDVLTRPRLVRKFPALTANAVDLFLTAVQSMSRSIDHVPRALALPRDPRDEPYINLALAGAADYLVSRDRDLLDLMNDDAFRRIDPSLLILPPVEFLKKLDEG